VGGSIAQLPCARAVVHKTPVNGVQKHGPAANKTGKDKTA
jgi:hypothetical protein